MSLHLVPDGEVDRHELHVACPCLPLFRAGRRPDGTQGHVVEHHARSLAGQRTEEQ